MEIAMKIYGSVSDNNGGPLKNILVSDGMNFALTDEMGAFSLETWEKASLVYCNVLTKQHDDWYKPIRADQEKYDFCINPLKGDLNQHSFLHLSDTEIMNTTCESFLPFVKEQAKKHPTGCFFVYGRPAQAEALRRPYEGSRGAEAPAQTKALPKPATKDLARQKPLPKRQSLCHGKPCHLPLHKGG